jgi:hypothetical protein
LESTIRKFQALGKVSVIDVLTIMQNSSDFEKYIPVLENNESGSMAFNFPVRFSMDKTKLLGQLVFR